MEKRVNRRSGVLKRRVDAFPAAKQRTGLFVVEESSDIFAHEYGHGFSKEREINAIEISKEAYYYIYKVSDMKFNQGTVI